MSKGADLAAIAREVSRAVGRRFDGRAARPVGGGSINAAWRLEGSHGPVFLKTNAPGNAWLFEAEADGLAALAEADCVRVPAVLASGCHETAAWLALEWVEFRSPDAGAQQALGEALAALHREPRESFGWRRDNAIGATSQPNTAAGDWGEFFATRRIGHQIDVAERRGLPGRLLDAGRRLQEVVPVLLAGRRVDPALLHGDLWGGNWAADEDGAPVVFDPAVYCGDPEADIAMTRLFGGFGSRFHAAYESVLPRAPGYDTRQVLYQIYHVLNHANLFGGGYIGQAEGMIGRLLAVS